VPLFVLDPTGVILAGPPDFRSHLTREVIDCLRAEPSVRLEIDGLSFSAAAVEDPDSPWLVVRLEQRVRPTPLATSSLTERQLEVARLAALGRRCHEIGAALGCSTNTVRSHLRIIYDRLAVTNRVELTRALDEA